ncbi:hypothetical protein EJ08DRAFT_653535 [Tothia fuscella]|uniref:Uncharacterized protein n=1 Tax=Tothia fuscella TaxID=1048955 RepID=A0A9P4NHJ2_9PEZI|nr:hypothetical protein EJ08DRAFT_653535 [Tothia fuscella]
MAALDTVVIQAIPAMLCGLLHGALSVYSCCNAPICCCDSIRRRRYSRADPSDAFGSQVGGTMVERPLDAPPAYRSEVGTTNIVGVPSVQYV